MQRWKYFNPTFDYRKSYTDYNSPWLGHSLFAYDLVRNINPAVIVELGTHRGTSLYAFSQALKDMKSKSAIYAIDSWKGDLHAGFYDESIYRLVKQIMKEHYCSVNYHLIREYFNEAVRKFRKLSIDILHIDGLHTYDAVKEDYETWGPLVRGDGIIIFHDIFVDHFGVKDLWKEVKNKNPSCLIFEFYHNYGLGVLFKNKNHDFFSNTKNIENTYATRFIKYLRDIKFAENYIESK